jgi:hypothetical protein
MVARQRQGQGKGVLTNRFSCFDPTAVGKRPVSQQQAPMLKDHRNELGVQFTEDAPGIASAPGGYLSPAFPQFEQQLDSLYAIDKKVNGGLPGALESHTGFPPFRQ